MPIVGSNCIHDCDFLILDLESIIPQTSMIPVHNHNNNANNENAVVIPDINKTKIDIHTYIEGYLLKKVSITKCEECKIQFSHIQVPDNGYFNYIRNKMYRPQSNLQFPKEEFIEFRKGRRE